MLASATLTTVPSIITIPEPSTVVASTHRPAAVPMRSSPASAMAALYAAGPTAAEDAVSATEM